MAIIDELAKGMGVTLKNFFKKPITVQYPKQQRHQHARFRGAVGFVRDTQTGKERCVGCGLCASVCPSNCLTVVPGVDEHGIRNAKIYLYDMNRCVFCGMCVEVCPELALVMTHEYELSVADRSQMVLDAEAMLKLADREQERTGFYIEEPGFPAFENHPSGHATHKNIPEKAQHGNFQSHQPLLGKLPHGYPMNWDEYLKKKESGTPLAQGNQPPYLRQISNNYLPDNEKLPMPKAIEEFADQQKEIRTHLTSAADVNPVYRHEIVDQDINGKITNKQLQQGKGGVPFTKSWLPAPKPDADRNAIDKQKEGTSP
jgi:NADH-quinone oxidoreductase subunit I